MAGHSCLLNEQKRHASHNQKVSRSFKLSTASVSMSNNDKILVSCSEKFAPGLGSVIRLPDASLTEEPVSEVVAAQHAGA